LEEGGCWEEEEVGVVEVVEEEESFAARSSRVM
jgi:hypothetical protein